MAVILALLLCLLPSAALAQSGRAGSSAAHAAASMNAALRGTQALLTRMEGMAANGAMRDRVVADAVAARGLLRSASEHLLDLNESLYNEALRTADDLVAASGPNVSAQTLAQRIGALEARLNALQDAVTDWEENGIAVGFEDITVAPGSTVSIPLLLTRTGRTGVGVFHVELAYDPSVFRVRDALSSIGSVRFLRDAGRVTVDGSLERGISASQGTPPLAVFVVDVIGQDGDGSAITVHRVTARESGGGLISAVGEDGAVWIAAPVELPPQTLGPGFLATRFVAWVLAGGVALYVALRVIERMTRPRAPALSPAAPAPGQAVVMLDPASPADAPTDTPHAADEPAPADVAGSGDARVEPPSPTMPLPVGEAPAAYPEPVERPGPTAMDHGPGEAAGPQWNPQAAPEAAQPPASPDRATEHVPAPGANTNEPPRQPPVAGDLPEGERPQMDGLEPARKDPSVRQDMP